MKKPILAFMGLVGTVVLLLAACAPAARPGALIDRGKYLATAGPCVECHTGRIGRGPEEKMDTTKILAGGRAFPEEFGTVYSRNITPDKATGIGNATKEQMEKAIREGVGIDGRPLVPPMPRYNGLAKEDVDAIVAYIQSVSAIANKPPASDLKAPRQALTFPAGPRGPDKAPTKGVERGGYLVNNLLGCPDCHTPIEKGKFDFSRLMAGQAKRFGPFNAPNITPDKETGIGNWTDAQITAAIKAGVNKEGRPMVVMPSLDAYKNLTDDDVKAVVAYLRTVKPVANKIPANVLPPPPPR